MNIANYGGRINSVSDIKKFGKVKNEYLKQHRFSVKNNSMLLEEVKNPNLLKLTTRGTILKTELFPYRFHIQAFWI